MARPTSLNARLIRTAHARRSGPAISTHPRTPSTRVNSPSTAGALAYRVPASHLTSDAIPKRENS